jgi:orotidine-5'-phosphate decarboxylase
MSERIIHADRSIIIGADVQPEEFEDLIVPMRWVEAVSAVKIGFEVAWGGLQEVVYRLKSVRDGLDTNQELVAIYDHQKAGNDIDKTGKNFARGLARAEIDAAILFPFTGREVQRRWTAELQDKNIGVLVGSEMTHPGFRQSEGGRIADDQLMDIFEQAVEEKVTDFVVPGNKPKKVAEYRAFFEQELGAGNFSLYAPGFIDQGGNISEAGKVAGNNWHAIVATAIIEAEDRAAAATELGRQIIEEAA